MTNSLKIFRSKNIVLTALFVFGLFFLISTHVFAACNLDSDTWNAGTGVCTHADGSTDNGGGGGSNGSGNGTNNGGNGSVPAGAGELKNPLNSKDIPTFLLKIIEVLLVFALPLIVLYIMYAGYLFVTAAGNSEKITTARSALLWSVVGGVIVLGARLIIAVIQGTIAGF